MNMQWLGQVHGATVHRRRVLALADSIVPLIEPGWSIADVGSGDGRLAALIAERAGCRRVQGFDVLVRPGTAIQTQWFDGARLPLPNKSVDAVTIIDVLHHTDDPQALMLEARRVARRAIIIKDHRKSRPLAGPTLRFMDFVGNYAHGVALPYNYWSMPRWRRTWRQLELDVASFRTELGLYAWPANWAFEAGLHFLAKLTPPARG